MGNWERISGSKSKLCFIKLIGFTFRRTTRNGNTNDLQQWKSSTMGNTRGVVYRQEKHTNEQRSFSTSPNTLIRAGCGGLAVCVYVALCSIPLHFSFSKLLLLSSGSGHARVEYEARAFSIPRSFGFEFYSIFSFTFSICFAQ